MLAELRRAAALHRRGSDRLALEVLESVYSEEGLLSLDAEMQVRALDLLAKLCERAKNLPKARRYAKRAVRAHPTDLRGYLRLGKLLQLSAGRRADAARVYERALRSVPALMPAQKEFVDRQLEMCRKLEDADVEACRASPVGVDFTLRLPPELCALIFAQLSFAERLNCTAVCQRWKRHILGNSLHFKQLDFVVDYPRKNCTVRSETVAQLCALAKTSFSLQFKGVKLLNSDRLFFHLAGSGCLSRLCALRADQSSVHQVSPSISNLKACGRDFPLLRVLSVCSSEPMADILWCLTNLSALESLELYVQHAEARDAAVYASLSNLNVKASKLSRLAVYGSSSTFSLSNPFLFEISKLPSLTDLTLIRAVGACWPFAAPAIISPNLRRFQFASSIVGQRDLVPPHPMLRFHPKLEDLLLIGVTLSADIRPIGSDGLNWSDRMPPTSVSGLVKHLELRDIRFVGLKFEQALRIWCSPQTLESVRVHSVLETGLEGVLPITGTVTYPKVQILGFAECACSDLVVDWLLQAFPNVVTANFRGTNLSGPQLVKLISGFKKLKRIQCGNMVDLSASTVEWARSLENVNVTF